MSRIVGLNAFEPDAIQLVSRKVKKDVCACVEKSLAPRKVNHNGSVELLFTHKSISLYCHPLSN